MNGGLAFDAVLTLLFANRFPVTKLMLLDDGAVAIAISIETPLAFAHGYDGADLSGANADLVRQDMVELASHILTWHQNEQGRSTA
jgi:hypothetical protein